MKIKKLMGAMAVAALTSVTFTANAGNIDANAARQAASNFCKRQASTAGTMFKAPSLSDIKLTHTEASSVEGNAYYVFNIHGGGWVIIAGDDRANQVLAYNMTGSLDMNNLPAAAKSQLNRFKTQIEKVQNFKGALKFSKTATRTTAVGPLLKSNWGQDYFFCSQCPTQYGSACPVGCAGTAMAQILNYWEYPKESEGLSSYYNTDAFTSVPALGATTFNYDLILDQYTYLTEDGRLGLVAGVTQENKDEVAKLCRYASQSCEMGFTATSQGSGTDVYRQYLGFLKMGYTTDAKLVGIEAVATRHTWNTWDYSDEEWTALINAQLEAGHPIPYSSEGGTDGHAYLIDGVDESGNYHCNWGFYGYADGYYAFGAFNPVILGQELELNDGFLYMIIDLLPYEGYVSPNAPGGDDVLLGDVNGDQDVTIKDVTELVNLLMLNGEYNEAGDVNHDGKNSITDITLLINYLMTGAW